MPYRETDDVTLYFREVGDGPVALFIHGFPFDSTMWPELPIEQPAQVVTTLRGLWSSG